MRSAADPDCWLSTFAAALLYWKNAVGLARIHRSETSLSLTQGMMGKGRRTGPARFQ